MFGANSIFVRQQLDNRANNSHVKGIIGPRINLVLLKCKGDHGRSNIIENPASSSSVEVE
jgi:hypothetical protein